MMIFDGELHGPHGVKKGLWLEHEAYGRDIYNLRSELAEAMKGLGGIAKLAPPGSPLRNEALSCIASVEAMMERHKTHEVG